MTPASLGRSGVGGCTGAPPVPAPSSPRRRRGLLGEYHHSRNLKKKMLAGSAYLSSSNTSPAPRRVSSAVKSSGARHGDGKARAAEVCGTSSPRMRRTSTRIHRSHGRQYGVRLNR
ncbi:hypothetical protein GLX27_003652 [Malassezia furfur]|uniref:Uncharacterized protein n=1 Tax=Malassezia furfur TaxID=55194 RepID=A0ABY8EV12_MALFU|nr:hypothetical protein GLX27_003652 [Malassezia furfur]